MTGGITVRGFRCSHPSSQNIGLLLVAPSYARVVEVGSQVMTTRGHAGPAFLHVGHIGARWGQRKEPSLVVV
jgi:hypothetical protein